jgi:hypothetical protein
MWVRGARWRRAFGVGVMAGCYSCSQQHVPTHSIFWADRWPWRGGLPATQELCAVRLLLVSLKSDPLIVPSCHVSMPLRCGVDTPEQATHLAEQVANLAAQTSGAVNFAGIQVGGQEGGSGTDSNVGAECIHSCMPCAV